MKEGEDENSLDVSRDLIAVQMQAWTPFELDQRNHLWNQVQAHHEDKPEPVFRNEIEVKVAHPGKCTDVGPDIRHAVQTRTEFSLHIETARDKSIQNHFFLQNKMDQF